LRKPIFWRIIPEYRKNPPACLKKLFGAEYVGSVYFQHAKDEKTPTSLDDTPKMEYNKGNNELRRDFS